MAMQIQNIKANNKLRNSSFELLRIISMLLIVAHHFVVHGKFDLTASFSKNIFFLQSLSMFGKLGVNLFVLISGYFSCTLPPPKHINFKKLLKLELEVIFYSGIIGIIFYNFSSSDFDFIDLLKTFTPLRSNCYWFYRSYFVLYLISPFLNSFIKAIDKTEFRKLLLTISILWIILPFFPNIPAIEISNLTWFIFLYLCAAYIRYYQDDFQRNISFYSSFTIIVFLLIILSVLSFDLLGKWKKIFLNNYDYFLPMNSILIFTLSISTLILFSKIDIGNIKWINIISSATFGVYLIHDNKLMRNLLWVKIFKNQSYTNSNKLILYSIATILIVYILCTFIDLIRIYILEKPMLILLSRNKTD